MLQPAPVLIHVHLIGQNRKGKRRNSPREKTYFYATNSSAPVFDFVDGFVIVQIHALFTPFDEFVGAPSGTVTGSLAGLEQVTGYIQDAVSSGIKYGLSVGATIAWNALTSLPANHGFNERGDTCDPAAVCDTIIQECA